MKYNLVEDSQSIVQKDSSKIFFKRKSDQSKIYSLKWIRRNIPMKYKKTIYHSILKQEIPLYTLTIDIMSIKSKDNDRKTKYTIETCFDFIISSGYGFSDHNREFKIFNLNEIPSKAEMLGIANDINKIIVKLFKYRSSDKPEFSRDNIRKILSELDEQPDIGKEGFDWQDGMSIASEFDIDFIISTQAEPLIKRKRKETKEMKQTTLF